MTLETKNERIRAVEVRVALKEDETVAMGAQADDLAGCPRRGEERASLMSTTRCEHDPQLRAGQATLLKCCSCFTFCCVSS